MKELEYVIDRLSRDEPLEEKYRDHHLEGCRKARIGSPPYRYTQ